MSGPLDVSGIRRDYEAAREHLNNNWACCSGHRLGAEVPLLLAEVERLAAELNRLNAVHRCDRDCPPVGVAGAVPTGEVYDPTATPPELAIMGRLLPWTVQACADLDHPIGIYNARTNASYCVCGAAMVSGDYRLSGPKENAR